MIVARHIPGGQLFRDQRFHRRGVPHHHKPVAHIENDRKIVTDADEVQRPRDRLRQSRFALHRYVHRCCRRVEHLDARRPEGRAGNRHAPALAAGRLSGAPKACVAYKVDDPKPLDCAAVGAGKALMIAHDPVAGRSVRPDQRKDLIDAGAVRSIDATQTWQPDVRKAWRRHTCAIACASRSPCRRRWSPALL